MAFRVLSAIFRKTKHCYQSLYSFLVNVGTPTKEVNLNIFLLWVMTEMQWLQYTQSLNLCKTKSCKNTKIVYTCEQFESFFSNLIPKDTLSHLTFVWSLLLGEGFEPSLKM